MSRIKDTTQRADGLNRLVTWPLLCGLLCLALARMAPAQPVQLYSNSVVRHYIIPGSPPIPAIDAVNFYNSANAFTVDFTNLTVNSELFETEDTVNYTNVGVMVSDSGFQFDNQSYSTGLRTMSGLFYNSHEIDCGLSSDTNVNFLIGAGQCIIWATNVVNPGHINIGSDGLLRITGGNVNLSHSTLKMEGSGQTTGFNNGDPFDFGGFLTDYGITGLTNLDYGVGADANLDWDPSIALTTNSATSALFSTVNFPGLVNQMVLTNSTAYVLQTTNAGIVRMVFLLNSNPGVSNNVYINGESVFGLSAGTHTTEFWVPYTDPSSGLPATNHLYLTDRYFQENGQVVPPNFSIIITNSALAFGTPVTPGFPTNYLFSTYDPGGLVVTNSYASFQFSPFTVNTNSPSFNVSNYLAILPGRFEINATNELNLDQASIAGPNYISIYSPTQFDGSSGAQIFSPYADINVGVTNGFLTLSNLLQSGEVSWNGTLQIWSGKAEYTNPISGGIGEIRIDIINSQLSPTTPALVQHMTLHGTNSIVISDFFNIIGTFSADSLNLTVTTNSPGAFSTFGGLNMETPNIVWSSSTPNLRNLTNNGVINLENVETFGNTPPSDYYSLVNNGTISDYGSFIWADNFTSSGVFSNGLNSFMLQSKTATFSNGLVLATGDVSITTSNLFATNSTVLAGQQLAIVATNVADGGAPSGNFWSAGGSLAVGLNVPVKPSGDLLGTTITNIAADNVEVFNTWPGEDRGASVAGFSNDVAVGRLVLDSFGSSHPTTTRLIFNGTGASNAIYVDELILADAATNLDSNHNVKALGGPANNSGGGANDNDNVVIYYARAIANGNDVSEKLDFKNNKRLRWVPGYAGYFSSTNIIYTNIVSGMTNYSTNMVNAALAQSTDIDSDGDGVANAQDSTPFFVPGEVNFKLTVTNKPPLTALISWRSIPAATNYVLYRTNLVSVGWQVLTNFISPSAVPPAGGWPLTNTVSDVVNLAQPRYYRVRVDPNAADLYGGF